ncbi:MAG TPA: type II toxin-antitoxin system HicA family toxin [Phycisphaerae bacterium]|nr:type II toxin-antitoxin system HicA family toxin [Phycisphaerae bacterium]HUT57778.1 type II toxin-antitoxin system HicA family toxin [Phycisphaerae bacterium]
MGKLTSRPTGRVLAALKRAGWVPRKTGKGSRHHVLTNEDIPGIVTVPRHRVVKKGTLGQIIKAAGMTLDTFEELYR